MVHDGLQLHADGFSWICVYPVLMLLHNRQMLAQKDIIFTAQCWPTKTGALRAVSHANAEPLRSHKKARVRDRQQLPGSLLLGAN